MDNLHEVRARALDLSGLKVTGVGFWILETGRFLKRTLGGLSVSA
jgi:hypothetical protein